VDSISRTCKLILTACLVVLAAQPAVAQDLDELLKPVAKPALEPVIAGFGPGDLRKTEAQRAQVQTLAQRHLGVKVGERTATDLRAIQRLLDQNLVARDDEYGQQALGVVLGDALARDHRTLAWAVVDDRYGHSRALRYRDTANLFFPVTMISKRVQAGERVDVQALYDQVAGDVAKLETQREADQRRMRGRR